MNRTVENLDEQNPVLIAEYRLLNALYLNPQNFLETGVERDVFVHQTCKDTFDAMQKLNTNGIPQSKNAIFQDASARNINVTPDFIQAFINVNTDPNVVIKDAVEMLQDTASSLQGLEKIEQAKKIINSNPLRSEADNDKIRQLLYEAENFLMPITKKQRIKTFEEVEETYLDNFEQRKNGKQYKFGDPVLDKAVKYGPAPGSGGLIAAATGMGKSAFCLNLINRCINSRVPMMYYSLEMGETDTFDRLMALRSNIDMDDLVNPADQESWQMVKDQIKQQFEVLKQNPNFRFSECASISLTQIKQDIKKFQQDIAQEYCIVVFDLLSMVKEFMITDDKGMNFAQGIEVAINILNAMAKELGFHYIAVLQMNRKGEGEGRADDLDDLKKFRPVRNQIKNSGAFLERVRWAVGLFRAKYYAEQMIEDRALWEDMPDYCEISMLKQNQGQVGLVGKYLFDPTIMSMIPVEEDDEPSSD